MITDDYGFRSVGDITRAILADMRVIADEAIVDEQRSSALNGRNVIDFCVYSRFRIIRPVLENIGSDIAAGFANGGCPIFMESRDEAEQPVVALKTEGALTNRDHAASSGGNNSAVRPQPQGHTASL